MLGYLPHLPLCMHRLKQPARSIDALHLSNTHSEVTGLCKKSSQLLESGLILLSEAVLLGTIDIDDSDDLLRIK